MSRLAFAQSAPGDAPGADGQPIRLERFEVTGSYIPYASTQTALPLTTFDAQAIDDAGISTSVLEVLRKAAPQFSGNGNIGNANANADQGTTGGGSKLAFRNTQTLVLVNGRRMTYAPSLAAGGFQFVDVNLIPLAAIERIEVLQDGASATYGTDAVGGVVNIILKTNFRGFEAGARFAVSPNSGHYRERSFSIVGGTSAKNTAVTVSAEYTRSDPLLQRNRSFSNPSYGTASFAGVINTRTPGVIPQYYILNPALNAPPAGHTDLAVLVAQGVYLPVSQFNLSFGLGSEQPYAFNLANAVTLLLENRRQSATLNFEHRASNRLAFFGDIIGTRTETQSQLNAQPLFFTLPPTNPANPTTQTMQVRNRYTERPRRFNYLSDSLRVIAGARGSLASGFQWEAAANRNAIHQDYTNPNLIDTALSSRALNAGLFDLSARSAPPGALEAAGFYGTAWGRATSNLSTIDAHGDGELLTLPAGTLRFAVGTEYRVEALKQTADRNSLPDSFNWNGGVIINPFAHDRNVWSSFVEVRVPLVGAAPRQRSNSSLELSAALRHERYSDTDNPTVPKYSLAWRPVPGDLLVRATYSESFAAPTLFELFGPTSVNDEALYVLEKLGGGQFAGQGHIRSGSNPDLLPSRSKNVSAGLVWSPKVLRGVSVTTDFFDVKQTDLVSTIDSGMILQQVELKGAASPYARFVRLGGFNGRPITAPGQISGNQLDTVFATATLVNISNQELRGVDVRIEYSRPLGAFGRIATAFSLTTYRRYSYRSLPSVASIDTVGLATVFGGTIPRWQNAATLGWSNGPWRAHLGWQHIPGVSDPQGDGTPRRPFAISTYDAFDLAAAYTFRPERKILRGLTLRAGANNVFNAMPRLGGGTFTGSNADINTYNPIGRLLFAEAKYRF